MPSTFPTAHDDDKARTLAALVARIGPDAVASRQAEVRAQVARDHAIRTAETMPPGAADLAAARWAKRPTR